MQQGCPAVRAAVQAQVFPSEFQATAAPKRGTPRGEQAIYVLIHALGHGVLVLTLVVVVGSTDMSPALPVVPAEAVTFHHVPAARGRTQYKLHLPWLQEDLGVPVLQRAAVVPVRERRMDFRQGVHTVPASHLLLATGGVDVRVGLQREQVGFRSRRMTAGKETKQKRGW